jgi:hypothetical protein
VVSDRALVYCSHKAKRVQSMISQGWCEVQASTRPMKVDLSFCLQKGHKGSGPIRKVLGSLFGLV